MNLFKLAAFTAATVSLCAGAHAAVNLVANPGFETGDLTGWTTGSPAWGVAGSSNSFGLLPNSGNYFALTSCSGESCISPTSGAYISQDLATVAGQTYTLSFDLSNAFFQGRPHAAHPDDAGLPPETAVYWQGAEVFDVGNLAANAPNYTHYTLLGLVASSSMTTLRFNGRDDGGRLAIDDISVSVTSAPAVPEPASLAMMLAGLASVGGFAARRLGKEERRAL